MAATGNSTVDDGWVKKTYSVSQSVEGRSGVTHVPDVVPNSILLAWKGTSLFI